MPPPVLPAPIIYIGKAGGIDSDATLRQRIKMYLDFGAGKPVGHRGGRYIWQLQGSDSFIVAWLTGLSSEPRDVERQLIRDFEERFDKKPFANIIS